MTAVKCPYCEHQFRLNQVKPGKFKPTCKKCSRAFALLVKSGSDKSLVARTFRLEDLKSKKEDLKPKKEDLKSRKTPVSPDVTRVDDSPIESPARQSMASDTALPDQTRDQFTRATAGDKKVNKAGVSGDSFVENQQPAVAAAGENVPEKLGGYKVIRELGRGGLGVVYLAKQLSLDRLVALKTIQGKIATDSGAISRFIREAYSAAQLVHHNVIQIYDLGRDGETNFFSMEFVPGQNLSQLVKRQGPIDPEKAVGLILQGARGLHFAHSQGMVHRDVKPANLMLSDLGVVKVADLGLVKLAGDEEDTRDRGFDELAKMSSDELTMAGYAMGTASYMAPEQAENSSQVDHRADIYSLGCSLYVLLTGRPIFKGASAIEVITKHRNEPVVRPDLIVDRVDERLSDIVIKMVAKKPADRYNDLGEVIDQLEKYLGISSADVLNPDKKQVDALQQSQEFYYGLSLAKLRTGLPLGFAGFCLVGLLILGMISWRWATGIGSLAVVTPIALFLIGGIKDRGVLFEKVRELAFRAGIRRWLQAVFVLILLAIILFVAKLLTIWTVFAIVGIALAAAFYFGVDAQLQNLRQSTLLPIKDYVTGKRLAGADEHSLQRFVAKYSGKDWEEYFEDLFDYPAMRRARLDLATGEFGGKRRKFRPWRDWVVDRVNAAVDEEKKKDDHRNLQVVEREALVAAGVAPEKAESQAEAFADALIGAAAQWRSEAARVSTGKGAGMADPTNAIERKRARIKAMLAEARSGKYRKQKSLLQRLEEPLDLFLGSHVRFVLGTLLVVGCALWIRQNGIFDSVTLETLKNVGESAKSAIENRSADVGEIAAQAGIDANRETEPLKLPVIGGWFTSFAPGLAGLLLIVLAFFRGWRMSLFAIPAALIAWCGPAIGIPGFGVWIPAEVTSFAIAAIIAAAGLMFGRTRF